MTNELANTVRLIRRSNPVVDTAMGEQQQTIDDLVAQRDALANSLEDARKCADINYRVRCEEYDALVAALRKLLLEEGTASLPNHHPHVKAARAALAKVDAQGDQS